MSVSAVRRPAQGDLAERAEVGSLEEAVHGPGRLRGYIHLSLAQALEQFAGGEVDHLDGIGLVKDAVRHGLLDLDAGHLPDHVVDAVDVLDVQGGVDADAGGQQFFHVHPALRVAKPGRVGVGQFVHQDDPRMPRERRVEVELAQRDASVLDLERRQGLKPFQQGVCLGALVGLHVAHHQIHARRSLPLRRLEHGVGLTHSRHIAEEDLELAARRTPLLLLQSLQQAVRIRSFGLAHERLLDASRWGPAGRGRGSVRGRSPGAPRGSRTAAP